MAEKTPLQLVSSYYNSGTEVSLSDAPNPNRPAKRPLKEFREEWSALTEDDKQELAEGVAAITGDTVK
jgi:hypothetical protein